MKPIITLVMTFLLFMTALPSALAQNSIDKQYVDSLLSVVDKNNSIHIKSLSSEDDIQAMTRYERMLACYLTGNFKEILDDKLYEGSECRRSNVN